MRVFNVKCNVKFKALKVFKIAAIFYSSLWKDKLYWILIHRKRLLLLKDNQSVDKIGAGAPVQPMNQFILIKIYKL